MPTTCPKCRYVRKATDTAPDWQCPACQVAYNKVSDIQCPRDLSARSAVGYVPRNEVSSHTWKWIVAIVIAVAVAWKGNFFSRTNAPIATAGIVNADGQPAVAFYSAAWCGYCRATRDFLDKNGLAYTEIDIEASEKAAQEYASLGGGGIPLVFVGEERMRGFNPSWMQSKLGPWMKR